MNFFIYKIILKKEGNRKSKCKFLLVEISVGDAPIKKKKSNVKIGTNFTDLNSVFFFLKYSIFLNLFIF